MTREFAIDLARRAGEVVLDLQRRGLEDYGIRTKRTPLDLLTAADLASERLIVDAIRARFPEHGIYAEESATGQPPETEWLWLIDPIDGTTNYAHAVPLFAINIALAHFQSVVLGITYEPASGRMHWAERGSGAWLRQEDQDRRLHVTATGDLGHSLLATGFPVDRLTNRDNNLQEFAALEVQVHGVRRFGSAALDLAWVAAGILDGYWENRLNPWDWAAGSLLVEEAGGSVTDYAGETWRLSSRSMIASNGRSALHGGMLETIGAVRRALVDQSG